jgi:phosphoribosylformylglycinamidine synthase
MGQFVGCVTGMAEACRALDFPVVSGNVSLYNETKNEDGSSLAILPTPAIGAVGLLDDWATSATIGLKAEGEALLLLGHSTGHVGQSIWLDVCHGRREGEAPRVDLSVERRLGELLRQLIAAGVVSAVHDVSDGGALVAIAEMALAGSIGVRLTLPTVPNPAAVVFGEDQGRALVATSDPEGVTARASASGIFAARVGETGGSAVEGPGFTASLTDLRAAHEGFFPKLMGSELTPEF